MSNSLFDLFSDLFSKKSAFEMSKKGEKILYSFAKSYDRLDDIIKSGEPFYSSENEKWHELLNDLGNSFSQLYFFHTFLISEHPYFQKNPMQMKLISFYMDMNASGLKNNFFKEKPAFLQEYAKISVKNLRDIYMLGARVLDFLDEDEMKINLYLFYHKIFVTYDFIYYSLLEGGERTTIGIFTQFNEDAKKYSSASEVILPLKNVQSSSEYRKNSIFIIQDVMRAQFDKNSDNIDKYHEDFFKDYIKSFYEEPIEPLTYLLAHKLWKLNKMIQYRFEQNNESFFDNSFKELIKSYISEQIDIGKKYYSDKNIKNFALQTYLSDLKLAELIFEDIHHRNIDQPLQVEKKALNSKIDFDDKITNRKNLIKSSKSIDENILKEALDVIHDKNSSKFNKIFKSHNSKQLIQELIYALDAQMSFEENSEYIGLYRSGALLAHCINIINGLDKDIFLFTSFPFIALHPTSYDSRNRYNNFIIFDESYKTGFTSLLSQIYIARGKGKKRFQTLALVNFNDYKKINFSHNYFTKITKTVLSINKFNDIKFVGNQATNSQKYDLAEYFKEIEKITDDLMHNGEPDHQLKEYVKELVNIKHNNQLYLDVTRILSRTNLLFILSLYFWRKIKKEGIVSYFLHAPSDEGRLIAEAIALVATMTKNGEYSFLFNTYELKEDKFFKKIFVDLTIDSGTNLKHSLKRDILHNDRSSDEECFSYYDDIVVILKSEKSKLKIKRDIISISTF